MKKNINYKILALSTTILLLVGCVGSDDSGDIMQPDAVSYNSDIRAIIDNNCIICHTDPPENGAPMPLNSYNALRNAVETRGLLTRINSISSPMPPTGLLPDAPRELIQAWVDQDFPEN